jgi:hypothetical protein
MRCWYVLAWRTYVLLVYTRVSALLYRRVPVLAYAWCAYQDGIFLVDSSLLWTHNFLYLSSANHTALAKACDSRPFVILYSKCHTRAHEVCLKGFQIQEIMASNIILTSCMIQASYVEFPKVGINSFDADFIGFPCQSDLNCQNRGYQVNGLNDLVVNYSCLFLDYMRNSSFSELCTYQHSRGLLISMLPSIFDLVRYISRCCLKSKNFAVAKLERARSLTKCSSSLSRDGNDSEIICLKRISASPKR